MVPYEEPQATVRVDYRKGAFPPAVCGLPAYFLRHLTSELVRQLPRSRPPSASVLRQLVLECKFCQVE